MGNGKKRLDYSRLQKLKYLKPSFYHSIIPADQLLKRRSNHVWVAYMNTFSMCMSSLLHKIVAHNSIGTQEKAEQ